VWLLDEPYEVDDTASWSKQFNLVFVNDAASLTRHRNAHELQVAYAPLLHPPAPGVARAHRVGFIGGANPARERMLGSLARQGLLDYVVGGPWRDSRLSELCLSANVPAEKTAEIYRNTAIVVNVFRDRHHFNRAGLEARSMNPRIAEALACGALVISEPREDLLRLVPELPTFGSEAEAVALIEGFVANPAELARVQKACAARLADATYAQRLRRVMNISLADLPLPVPVASLNSVERERVVPYDDEWDDVGSVVRRSVGSNIVIDAGTQSGPGAERGLASRASYDAVDLTFEARLEAGARLLAKVHQTDRIDQTTNSYHLHIDSHRAYLARHCHVFRQFEAPGGGWTRFRLACGNGELSLWRNDRLLHRVRDRALTSGFAFVGAQGGTVRLRQLRISNSEVARGPALANDNVQELLSVTAPSPRLSIITTVYDRTECLKRCIASVQRLTFANFEQVIVADHPAQPGSEVQQLGHCPRRSGTAARTRRICSLSIGRQWLHPGSLRAANAAARSGRCLGFCLQLLSL
jgi:hypothetical protein